MSESFKSIRREGQKYACLAAQTEGETQKAHFVRAVICDAFVGILEDPEMRAKLYEIVTAKPNLRLVHSKPFDNNSNQESVLLGSE